MINCVGITLAAALLAVALPLSLASEPWLLKEQYFGPPGPSGAPDVCEDP